MNRCIEIAAGLLIGLQMIGTTCAEPAPKAATPIAAPANVARQIHPRWRGNNTHSPDITPQLIERLAALGCNALRINLETDSKQDQSAPPSSGDALLPFKETIARIDAVLPLCQKYGIQVILSASGIPGRKIDVFWSEANGKEYRSQLVSLWRGLARHYRNQPAIIGYDLLNEPTYDKKDAASWWDETIPQSIAAIRESDKTVWIVVEPGPWGLPSGFESMPVVPDSRVLYSFHHYMPHAYTHQGVSHLGRPKKADTRGKFAYPGSSPNFENETALHEWNKAQLEKSMQRAIDFQKRNPGVRIYVGEFGVIRWAQGADQWLKDSIALFEEHGWDWTFHSVGGWNGWDPTYSAQAPLNSPAGQGTETTARLQVLQECWKLNKAATTPK